ncbi:unnamed protein product [Triticum turgidum subsp. durum]|uniref:Thiol protease aleurain n=1 Tax=Triticum turgidum subsp. durum TaxID=4567 RepID=A0A9R1ALR9_TRITD|nr:unnamed protein product [Triticum turgidum subsp. durum]
MAHGRILPLALAVLATAAVAVASSSFTDSNPIRPVTERAASTLESTVLAALGRTRHALRFARFAVRYGKSYESAAEVRRRFRIFSESLEEVRSTNRKGLSYRLGSCWTFSTTGALEAAYTQATGKNISLSEQQLVDCAGGFNNFGCSGGLPSQAFEYIKYNGGIDTEESYPYKGVNGVCHYKAENAVVQVLDSVNITLNAEDELKNAVGLVRPVSVAFEVIDGFRQYKSGVYTSDHCGTTPDDVNHAVLAVGYGVENGVPYWLIKNSWGADWGENGYFKMEMGKNMCAVATCASYPIVAA